MIYYMYVSKSLCAYNFLPILVKPLVATAAMVAFILYTDLRLLIIVPLSAIIYFAAIFLLKSFDKEDYEIFRKVLKKPEAAK